MKKIIIVMFAVIVFIIGCSVNSNSKSENEKLLKLTLENEKLNQKTTIYESTIELFKNVGKFNINVFENIKSCSFTRTYKVYKILNEFNSTVTLNQKYVILTSFQSEKLILVLVDKNLNLRENKVYEFKFDSSKNYILNTTNEQLLFEQFNIVSVNETTKIGLEQVNEIIICN